MKESSGGDFSKKKLTAVVEKEEARQAAEEGAEIDAAINYEINHAQSTTLFVVHVGVDLIAESERLQVDIESENISLIDVVRGDHSEQGFDIRANPDGSATLSIYPGNAIFSDKISVGKNPVKITGRGNIKTYYGYLDLTLEDFAIGSSVITSPPQLENDDFPQFQGWSSELAGNSLSDQEDTGTRMNTNINSILFEPNAVRNSK